MTPKPVLKCPKCDIHLPIEFISIPTSYGYQEEGISEGIQISEGILDAQIKHRQEQAKLKERQDFMAKADLQRRQIQAEFKLKARERRDLIREEKICHAEWEKGIFN